jgi:hypothetical protein
VGIFSLQLECRNAVLGWQSRNGTPADALLEVLRYALTNKARMALFAAGSASGTDKVTHHAYHRFYQTHVDALLARVDAARQRPALLEIGVAGGASVPMWRAAP